MAACLANVPGASAVTCSRKGGFPLSGVLSVLCGMKILMLTASSHFPSGFLCYCILFVLMCEAAGVCSAFRNCQISVHRLFFKAYIVMTL